MQKRPPRKTRTFALFKPYGMMSQFTPVPGKTTLAEIGIFPRDVYPVGRLDADSEGLLILTNDNRLKALLLEPRRRHPRTYWVQVEGVPDEAALSRLRDGVVIDGRRTLPAHVRLLGAEPELPPRPVPVRYRRSIPTSWIAVTITEGRNRQVRRMTASVGHPALRLVRVQIGALTLGRLLPGDVRELSAHDLARLRSPGEPSSDVEELQVDLP